MVAEREQTLEERHAAARIRWLAHYEGDPEMQEIVRKAKFDTESTPEEDAEDIRIANERRAKGVTRPPRGSVATSSLRSTPTKRNISSPTY